MLLFSLAISQDRTRVENFFRQATVTAVALAAQPTAADIARAMPTQPSAPVTQVPLPQADDGLADDSFVDDVVDKSPTDTADIESPPAEIAGQLAGNGQTTNDYVQASPDVEAGEPVAVAPQQTPISSSGDRANEQEVVEVAQEITAADRNTEADGTSDTAVDPSLDSPSAREPETQIASAAAAVAASAFAADEESGRALRLPSPTPAPILQPSLQTATPAPEIGVSISSTAPITALASISLTGTPVGGVLAPTPAPEIGVPISLTVPATVTATPGAADISTTPLPPDIGEPISTTAVATLAVTAPVASAGPSLPVPTVTAITTTGPATGTPLPPEIGEPISTTAIATLALAAPVTSTVTFTAPITPTKSPLQPTSTATAAPSPTATPAAPTSTATSTSSPTPSPTPTALVQCPTGLSGSLEHQAKYYGGPIAAYSQDERMAVALTVSGAPPGELGSDRLNLYVSDRAQFARIVEEADQPREHHIEAGVLAPDAESRLVAAIGRPVGDFYLTIVNDSGVVIDFCLTIENGVFQ